MERLVNCPGYVDVFAKESIGYAGLALFRALSYTDREMPIVTSSDVLNFIYHDRGFQQTFTKEERSAFSAVFEISYISEIRNSYFKENSPEIQLYAIDFDGEYETASTLHHALARGIAGFSVILLRRWNGNIYEVLLSVFFKSIKNSYCNVLTKWINTDSDAIVFEKLKGDYLSDRSSRDFIEDFLYAVTSPYFLSDEDFHVAETEEYEKDKWDFKIFDGDVINNENYVFFEYGSSSEEDDGIEKLLRDIDIAELLSTDEDEGLTEYEDADEEFEESFDEEYPDVDEDEIPDEAFDDPTELLKWL